MGSEDVSRPLSGGELSRHWVMLLAASVGVICSSIVLPFYSIGALVVPVTAEFGWSRAEFQLAILFSTGAGVLTAPLVGWAVERLGSRRVALSGLFGLSVALLVPVALDGQLWLFYLAYTLMALLGAGTVPVTWTRAVTSTFFRQRGLALGIMLSGTGVCAILIPQYTVFLVNEFGWRVAYAGLAALPLLLAVPLVFLFFAPEERPRKGARLIEAESGLSLREALRDHRFWILLVSIFLVYVAMSGMVPNLIPALIDKGIGAQQAALAISVFGVLVIVGRLLVGYLVDRIWAPGVGAVAIALPALGALILFGDPGLALACLAAGLLGFAAGAELDLMSFLAARYFGLRHYASIYGVLYAALALASGLSPSLFASIYDFTGSYAAGFAAGAGCFCLSALLILALGPYPSLDARLVDRVGRAGFS